MLPMLQRERELDFLRNLLNSLQLAKSFLVLFIGFSVLFQQLVFVMLGRHQPLIDTFSFALACSMTFSSISTSGFYIGSYSSFSDYSSPSASFYHSSIRLLLVSEILASSFHQERISIMFQMIRFNNNWPSAIQNLSLSLFRNYFSTPTSIISYQTMNKKLPSTSAAKFNVLNNRETEIGCNIELDFPSIIQLFVTNSI